MPSCLRLMPGEEEEVMVIAKEACEAAGIPYFAQVG